MGGGCWKPVPNFSVWWSVLKNPPQNYFFDNHLYDMVTADMLIMNSHLQWSLNHNQKSSENLITSFFLEIRSAIKLILKNILILDFLKLKCPLLEMNYTIKLLTDCLISCLQESQFYSLHKINITTYQKQQIISISQQI